MTNPENITTTNQTTLSSSNLSTELAVITLDDNLSHPYFTSISWTKDNYTIGPGSAILVMPYIQEMIDYWRKYTGTVVISAELKDQNNTYQSVDTINQPKERVNREKLDYDPINYSDDAKRNSEAPYGYSFVGRVTKVTQKGQKIHILLHDLGWKFSQKVPRTFRDSYISNQTLDDAFQAMCEFMGIEFAYSIKDLNELTFAEDGYSVKKDGEIIEDVPSLFREWENPKEEESDDLNSPDNENPGLIEYKQNKIVSPKTTTGDSITKKAVNTLSNIAEESLENQSEESEEEEKDNSAEDKIKKYQAEFDEKIKNLFIGNMMYNSDLTSNVMDYGNITISPKASASDSNQDITTVNSSGESTSDSDSSSSSDKKSSSSSGGSKAKAKSHVYEVFVAGVWKKTNYKKYMAATKKGAVTRMDYGKIHKNKGVYLTITDFYKL